jgi:hypothetical protein
MDRQRRKQLQEDYKKQKTIMGVIQIRNKENGKLFVAAYPNLKNKWLTIREQLDRGKHMNAGLQADWKAYGADAFEYLVLEQTEADEAKDKAWALKQMEQSWHERLTPYEDKGYHKKK